MAAEVAQRRDAEAALPEPVVRELRAQLIEQAEIEHAGAAERRAEEIRIDHFPGGAVCGQPLRERIDDRDLAAGPPGVAQLARLFEIGRERNAVVDVLDRKSTRLNSSH